MELLFFLRESVTYPIFYILIAILTIDLIMGILTGVKLKSKKTENGAVESRHIIKGLIKKIGILLLYFFVNIIDFYLNEKIISTFTISFILGSEGFSIIENMGLCGVPIPQKLRDIIEVLKNNDK